MTLIVDLREWLYTICPLGFMDLITEPEMFCGYCGTELLDWLHQCSIISFFSNLTHKTKSGIANMWETTNNNPPGPTKLSSQSIVGVRLCCAFYQPHYFSNVGPKPLCCAKLTCFDFSSSNFLLFCHILSTSLAALRGSILGSNIVQLWAKPLLVVNARRPFCVFFILLCVGSFDAVA